MIMLPFSHPNNFVALPNHIRSDLLSMLLLLLFYEVISCCREVIVFLFLFSVGLLDSFSHIEFPSPINVNLNLLLVITRADEKVQKIRLNEKKKALLRKTSINKILFFLRFPPKCCSQFTQLFK